MKHVDGRELTPAHLEEAGFSAIRWEQVDELVSQFVPEKIPGLVYLVGHRGKTVGPRAHGAAAVQPEEVPMAPDTIFDLASLTKVVATTTAAMLCLERGYFRLDDPVKLFVPGFTGDGKDQVRIRHLLTHTSGLPAWSNLAETSSDLQSAVEAICSLPLEYRPGAKVVYSCMGFILLGAVITRVTQTGLDEFTLTQVFNPLHMNDTFYRPPRDVVQRVAATEYDPVSGTILRGVVHDENARAIGGVSGNAGLFSTAEDLAIFAQMILNRGMHRGIRILSPAAVEAMLTVYPPGLEGARGLGWIVKGNNPLCSGGDLLSSRSIGHTGFTGTSLWIDFDRELFAVLLTNRVHPSRENSAHIRLRPLFHNAVLGALVS